MNLHLTIQLGKPMVRKLVVALVCMGLSCSWTLFADGSHSRSRPVLTGNAILEKVYQQTEVDTKALHSLMVKKGAQKKQRWVLETVSFSPSEFSSSDGSFDFLDEKTRLHLADAARPESVRVGEFAFLPPSSSSGHPEQREFRVILWEDYMSQGSELISLKYKHIKQYGTSTRNTVAYSKVKHNELINERTKIRLQILATARKMEALGMPVDYTGGLRRAFEKERPEDTNGDFSPSRIYEHYKDFKKIRSR